MDHIRERYFNTREQIQKEKEEQEERERQEKQREEERNEIMRFWQSHNTARKSNPAYTQRKDDKFDCEKFVKLTNVERKNLMQIKAFRLF